MYIISITRITYITNTHYRADGMSRAPRDGTYRAAFGTRLRQLIDVELKTSLNDIADALGYKDGSTLRSAMAGRCGLDLDKLATLAAWSRHQGMPVNLHWLLVGDGEPILKEIQPSSTTAGWMAPELQEALFVIADAAQSIPRSSPKR